MLEISALFDGFDPSLYEEEVKQRWGKTDACKESARRTSKDTKADWERYKAESHAIMTDAAKLFCSGTSADGDEAMAVAERHRLSLDRWFYPCAPEMHAGLADLYEADARFAKSIDQYTPGLTAWWSRPFVPMLGGDPADRVAGGGDARGDRGMSRNATRSGSPWLPGALA